MKVLTKWLTKGAQLKSKESSYVPKIRVQSTVNEGEGLSFNEKAEHIFRQIKSINSIRDKQFNTNT